ncbi:MAG: 3-hydroxyacyl-CoA dehydrogenase family protein, partial [Candidatus Omnitrophota bacterium]
IYEVGIDVGYKVAKILEEAYGSRMRVSSILGKVKEKGLLGKKSKTGFYIHKGKKKIPNPDISYLVKLPHGTGKVIYDDKALKRMIFVMINEAARCLEEGVVEGPETIDIGMITGTGFPPFRAGLLRYADSVGAGNIVEDLKHLKEEFKTPRFEPCKFLLEKAEKNENFYVS